MQHCFLLSQKSLRFLGSAMGIAIANRKNRCDFGALSCIFWHVIFWCPARAVVILRARKRPCFAHFVVCACRACCVLNDVVCLRECCTHVSLCVCHCLSLSVVCLCLSVSIHVYIYIYIYICVCLCVSVSVSLYLQPREDTFISPTQTHYVCWRTHKQASQAKARASRPVHVQLQHLPVPKRGCLLP